jgi:hypothetical protein
MGSGTFVGREEALAGAARAGAPLLIGGPIGIGKTAFALRLADELAGAFPDGQLYADLDGADAVTVVEGFLHALGVAHVPEAAAQRVALFRSLLAQRRLFVLLDNASDERQVRPLLGRSTASLIVVTSRARLLGLDGVHRVDLPPLPRAASVSLLGLLAGADRVRSAPGTAGTLADLCGNLPLAVSVAGRRLAARPDWTIAAMAALLGDTERMMTGLSVGDVKVRDVFAAAYRRLTPAARQALHQVAAAGPAGAAVTATGLAAALGVTADAADDLLESLVDSGLLSGRYGLPALTYAFAVSTPHSAPAPAPVDTIKARRLVRA